MSKDGSPSAERKAQVDDTSAMSKRKKKRLRQKERRREFEQNKLSSDTLAAKDMLEGPSKSPLRVAGDGNPVAGKKREHKNSNEKRDDPSLRHHQAPNAKRARTGQASNLVDGRHKLGATLQPPKVPAETNLSPLQTKMRNKLLGARFRVLNELLYTTSGSDAFQQFRSDPTMFEAYHIGYREQARQWPVNPLDGFIREVASHPTWIVADMGCGDARLAQSVKNTVHSFDLVSPPGSVVIPCDISHVPLGDASVDCVIFCLSLMGVNYLEFLREGVRILKPGGSMLVAEVVSRVQDQSAFIGQLETAGLVAKKCDVSNKMFVVVKLVKSQQVEGVSAGHVPSTSHITHKKKKKNDKFVAKSVSSIKHAHSKKGAPSIVAESSAALKPCIYKRRG